MAWLFLFIAGIAEIAFAVSLKLNEGFTKLWPSIATAISGIISFYLLTLSLKTLPVGTAYAVWTGMGAAGVAILGIFYFKEPADCFRLASLTLIIIGIVGLRLSHID